MIPTSGETTEPSKTRASDETSTVSRKLAGNTRTTKEAKNKPRTQVIIIEAEIVLGQKKRGGNITYMTLRMFLLLSSAKEGVSL